MAIRCDLHLNGDHRKLILAARPEETHDHLALKLAGFLLFWGEDPIVEPSAKHAALQGQEFRPDLLALGGAGEASLWVECGQVSLNKLLKVPRRFPRVRLVVLKETPEEARRLRRDLEEENGRGEVEVWAWPEGRFGEWRNALAELTEVFGEARGRAMNLVINHVPVAVDLLAF
jgi:hypothetical protein